MRSSGIRFRLLQAILGVAGSAAERSIDIVEIRQLEGAFSRPPAFANAVGGRDAAFAYFALTVVRDITDYSDAGETLDAALLPWRLQMGHPSFQGPADATVLGTRQAFDLDTDARLQTVKAKCHPNNNFRVNHNISPRSPV